MAYMVIHLSGNNEESYPLERLGELLAELDGNEDEEAYVALTHESEWCLSANPFGLLMWENNFSDITESWYMENVSKEFIISLWSQLAIGEIEEVKQNAWMPGDPIYGVI